MFNNENIYEFDCEPNTFVSEARKNVGSYEVNNRSYCNESLILISLSQVLSERCLEQFEFYDAYKLVLDQCESRYIPGIDYLLKEKYSINRVTNEAIYFLEKANQFKDLYEVLKYNFELIKLEYTEECEFDLDRFGNGFIDTLFKLEKLLEDMDIDTSCIVEATKGLRDTIKDLASYLEIYVKNQVWYFVHNELDLDIASLSMGYDFLDYIVYIFDSHINGNHYIEKNAFNLELICSIGYNVGFDECDEDEMQVYI